MSEPTEGSFLKDVAGHEMKVLLDNGIYRHLRFKKPGRSEYWFDIVTWPGFLAYTGDMGGFIFSRLEDMFKFFRTDRRSDEHLGINRSYWSEKLEAVDNRCSNPGYKQYSQDLLTSRIEEVLAEWISDYNLDKTEENELRNEVQSEVLSRVDESEHEARTAVRDFSYEMNVGDIRHKFEFQDSWEWDCGEYTYRFTWCCFAIAWAIKTYDAAKVIDENHIKCSIEECDTIVARGERYFATPCGTFCKICMEQHHVLDCEICEKEFDVPQGV